MSDAPIIHVSMGLRQTEAGQWVCYFTFNGKKREFVRPDMPMQSWLPPNFWKGTRRLA